MTKHNKLIKFKFIKATIISFFIFFFSPGYSFAAMVAVINNSLGASGVFSTTHVKHRFPEYPGKKGFEGYQVSLLNKEERNDKTFVKIILEIFEYYKNPDEFRAVTHIFFDDGRTSYPNDEYIYWGNIVSENAWHSLELHQDGGTGSSDFNAYIDGIYWEDFWYPYPSSNKAVTQLEVTPGSENLTSSDYYYVGHHKNIYLRASNGKWYLQNSSWANRIQYAYNSAPPYYISFFNNYYDWEFRR